MTAILRELLPSEAGYDYAQAVRELNRTLSYDDIAGFCGYQSKSSVADLAAGRSIPDHPRGERLYILYVETLQRKPPIVRLNERLPST